MTMTLECSGAFHAGPLDARRRTANGDANPDSIYCRRCNKTIGLAGMRNSAREGLRMCIAEIEKQQKQQT